MIHVSYLVIVVISSLITRVLPSGARFPPRRRFESGFRARPLVGPLPADVVATICIVCTHNVSRSFSLSPALSFVGENERPGGNRLENKHGGKVQRRSNARARINKRIPKASMLTEGRRVLESRFLLKFEPIINLVSVDSDRAIGRVVAAAPL